MPSAAAAVQMTGRSRHRAPRTRPSDARRRGRSWSPSRYRARGSRSAGRDREERQQLDVHAAKYAVPSAVDIETESHSMLGSARAPVLFCCSSLPRSRCPPAPPRSPRRPTRSRSSRRRTSGAASPRSSRATGRRDEHHRQPRHRPARLRADRGDARTMAGAGVAIVNGIGYDHVGVAAPRREPGRRPRRRWTSATSLGLKRGRQPAPVVLAGAVRKVIDAIVADYGKARPGRRRPTSRLAKRRSRRTGLARYDALIARRSGARFAGDAGRLQRRASSRRSARASA